MFTRNGSAGENTRKDNRMSRTVSERGTIAAAVSDVPILNTVMPERCNEVQSVGLTKQGRAKGGAPKMYVIVCM
jgi:hypothetical protein